MDDIDANARAEKFETSQQKVAGMVYSAKSRPRAYTELIANGASPGQIPPWFMRPGGEDAVITAPEERPSASLPPPSTPSTEVDLGNPEEIPPPGGMGQVGLQGPRIAGAEGGIALDLDAPTRHGGNKLGDVYARAGAAVL